jgi:Trp operon repressor
MDPLQAFQALLGELNAKKHPETKEEVAEHLGLLNQVLEKCEKVLLYMATTPSQREDMVTYLFLYKQLLNLQQQLSTTRFTQPVSPAKRKLLPKAWWK